MKSARLRKWQKYQGFSAAVEVAKDSMMLLENTYSIETPNNTPITSDICTLTIPKVRINKGEIYAPSQLKQ